MITRGIITPDVVSFLQDKTALYACDFRAVGDTTVSDMLWMWSYENLLPWILKDKFATANELSGDLKYDWPNRILVLERSKDSKISIFEKIPPDFISKNGLKSLWVPVAHPQADLLAQRHNLGLNFKYSDLVEYNNKLSQKKLLGGYTPLWRRVASQNDVLEIKKGGAKGFIKNSFAAAGNKIFSVDESGKDFDELFSKTPHGWFFEEYVEGIPHSVQCLSYRDQNQIIVFSFTQQLIAEGKKFVGSQILTLDDLDSGLWSQLESAIKALRPLVKDYEGFWGLDFVVQPSGKIFVLEANVRMTAVTVPALLASKYGWNGARYLEDIAPQDQREGDIVLTQDSFSGTVDVLRKAG